MPAPSLRARVRAELVEEIKAAARRRLAIDGPGPLRRRRSPPWSRPTCVHA